MGTRSQSPIRNALVPEAPIREASVPRRPSGGDAAASRVEKCRISVHLFGKARFPESEIRRHRHSGPRRDLHLSRKPVGSLVTAVTSGVSDR